MTRTTFFGALTALFGMTLSTASGAGSLDGKSGAAALATQRNVRGIITAVEGGTLTIQAGNAKNIVTGRIDPKKTRIFVGNVPAKAADLQLSAMAQAELTLDDVWETIRVTR